MDKTVQFDQPLESMTAAAESDPSMMGHLWAIQQLGMTKRAASDAAVDTLTRVLAHDRFYGVRAAAAASLASLGTDAAKSKLLTALHDPDSRVRAAVILALGAYSKNPGALAVLVRALQEDSSYAVRAAAARQIGQSGNAQAVEVLKTAVAEGPEVHVMLALLDGLAATVDSRATDTLLAESRPGIPKRVRLRALAGLASMKAVKKLANSQELIVVTEAAYATHFFRYRKPARTSWERPNGRGRYVRCVKYPGSVTVIPRSGPHATQLRADANLHLCGRPCFACRLLGRKRGMTPMPTVRTAFIIGV
jgi:HEAT repeats